MNWTPTDTWMTLTAALVAMGCALPGSILFLRRQSMLGDAISHAVLPGLALGFLLTESRTIGVMVAGAVAAALITVLLTRAIRDSGRVEEGASLGVVFITLFAVGLILIRLADEHRIDLDPSCVLFGSLETSAASAGPPPPAVYTAGFLLLANASLLLLFYKELKITSLDPALALTQGFHPRRVETGLLTVTAITTVLAFESVGSILVIAMLTAPATAARLLTHRLPVMLVLALVFAATTAVLGHLGALATPHLLNSFLPHPAGWNTVSSAGMMTLAGGFLVAAALLLHKFRKSKGAVNRV